MIINPWLSDTFLLFNFFVVPFVPTPIIVHHLFLCIHIFQGPLVKRSKRRNIRYQNLKRISCPHHLDIFAQVRGSHFCCYFLTNILQGRCAYSSPQNGFFHLRELFQTSCWTYCQDCHISTW